MHHRGVALFPCGMVMLLYINFLAKHLHSVVLVSLRECTLPPLIENGA